MTLVILPYFKTLTRGQALMLLTLMCSRRFAKNVVDTCVTLDQLRESLGATGRTFLWLDALTVPVY